MKRRAETQQRLLDITDTKTATENIQDLEKIENPDAFVLIAKASSKAQGFMKTTKAMQMHHGCLVQTETQQQNQDGSWAISQALAFVPGIAIIEEIDVNTGEKWRRLGAGI